MAIQRYAILVPWHIVAAVVFVVTTPVSGVSDPQYLGCFVSDGRNTSPYINVSPTPLSNVTCSDECLSNNYTFAALNKTHCRCSNNYFSQLMKLTDDDCDFSCTQGNSSDPCQTHFKMFKTQNTSEEHYPEAIYLGCYTEKRGDEANRLLKIFHEHYETNSPQKCSEECFKIGYLYSGTTYGDNLGNACWCGNQHPSNSIKTNDTNCDLHCRGDHTKFCGGSWKLSVYATGIVDYPLGVLVGCFKLDNQNQTGKKVYHIKDNNESHRCFHVCNERGYKYAAISGEYCECSNQTPSQNNRKAPDECNKCINNDFLEYCGGRSSVSVYENSWFGKVSGNLSVDHFGCFENSHMYPVMDGWIVWFPYGLTSVKCVTNCYTRGFPYAALISKNECLCSFDSPAPDAATDGRGCAVLACPENDVTGRPCEGDHRARHYDVYATGLRTARVAGDHYLGCYSVDATAGGYAPIDMSGQGTPRLCSGQCAANGYITFGLSGRDTCRCGDTPNARLLRDDGDCSARCAGDANKHCGGPSKAALFRTGVIADVIHNCSTTCDCFFLPKYNASRINCSKRNLTKLTETTIHIMLPLLPVELVLRDNSIQVQPDVKNLKIVSLDIGNNSIKTLNANLLPKSLKYLYINNNMLTTLDDRALRLISLLKGLRLSNNPWSCQCYLKTFLKYRAKIEDINYVRCSTSGKRLIEMSENDFCSNTHMIYTYGCAVLGFVLFVCVLSVYTDLRKKVWSYVRNEHCASCDITALTEAEDNADAMATFMQSTQYEELAIATDNWNRKNILGEGGFGIVYKGVWKHTEVAIKRLKSEGMAQNVVNLHTLGDELLNPSKEIKYLNAVKHDNILSIYGFCFHSMGSCLIYQYMANGSLEDRLQRKNGTKPLSWAMRGKITMGTARGLQFLHNAETPLIHGDIKSANILLDANFEPRIGDFGLARTGPLDHSDKKNIGFDVSRVCGTKPYLPDDFCANKKLSTKVDTYSFGVVMFEVATGLRAFNKFGGPRFLKNLVNKYDQHLMPELADKFAGKESFQVFEALVRLGKLCVADKAESRPEMVVVYMNLQNVISPNTCARQETENNEKFNESYMQFQDTGTTGSTQTTIDVDSIKLKGRKAALLAPLHEIPSISMLYTNLVRENDPRKNLTADDQCNSEDMLVGPKGYKYSQLK